MSRILPGPILLTQFRGPAKQQEATSQNEGTLRGDYGNQSRIVLISPDRPARVLTGAFHSACDLDISFDATRFLFAARRTADDHWNIYEMVINGGEVRQITRALGDCRSPSYQSSHYQITEKEPWQQITFVRAEREVVNEAGSAPATALYSCKLDGSLVRRLTFNLSSDFDPTVMWDGRLVYSTWQRRNFEHGVQGRVAIMEANTDGTDYGLLVLGEAGLRIKHMTCTTPDGLAVFIETDRVPWDGSGQLGSVSLLRPLHTYRSITAAADGLFHSPSPLPDGTLLVSRRQADGSGTHGVYRLEPKTKRMTLLFDDPQYHEIQAKAVAARAEPDGRSSSILNDDPNGKLYCLNVYTSDLKDRSWMPPGTATRLRILEGVPRKAGDTAEAVLGKELPQLAARKILGEIPVCPDGSFNIEVPANVPLELQLLDESGLALRSCGWIWTRNHFNQGCVGCHEDGELTPENYLVDAFDQPTIPVMRTKHQHTVDFRRDILPIVAAKCIGCHGKEGSPPLLGDTGQLDPRQVYLALRAPENPAAAETGLGKYIHPGIARTSPLVWHLFGRNTSRPWDGGCAARPAKPILPGQSAALTESERETLVRWIDLGASFEGVAPSTPGGSQP